MTKKKNDLRGLQNSKKTFYKRLDMSPERKKKRPNKTPLNFLRIYFSL